MFSLLCYGEIKMCIVYTLEARHCNSTEYVRLAALMQMMDDKLVNMWLPVSDVFTRVAMTTARLKPY